MIESCHDSCDGIRSTFSLGPEEVTSTFCRYSSTAASMSVELSLLLILPSSLTIVRQLSIVVLGNCCGCCCWWWCWFVMTLSDTPAGGAIVSVDVSCSSLSKIIVFLGDVGSPNRSHSLSSSSLRGCFLWRGFFGIDTMDGRHRRIRPPADVAVDKFAWDWCRIVDALLTECRNDVAVGFNWL